MEMLYRRLMLIVVPVLVFIFLNIASFVNGHRGHSWPRNPDYEDRDFDFRETISDFPKKESIELLNCSKNRDGIPSECVHLSKCPQIRFQPNQQYCSLGSNKYETIPFDGPYVCCPNFRLGPQSKPLTTLPSKRDKNLEAITPSHLSKRDTIKPNIDLTLRVNTKPDGKGVCGLLEKDEKLEARIIGSYGRQQILGAAIGGISLPSASQSPWTVAVGEYTNSGSVEWFCGGSLLSQYTVLTAAHCARRRRPEVVRVGEVDLRRNTRSGEGKGEEIRIKDVAMHPDYRPPSYYNDIAVLTLERPVDLRRPEGARTICLPPPSSSQASDVSSTYTGKEAILTGWGHLSFGGDRSPILQEVRVTVFSNDDCSRSYSVAAAAPVAKRSYPSGIINSQLCAGDRRGKKDACQGDSGGPLVVKGKDGRHSVIGVVSSGIGCGSKQYPGVYVRVSSYVDWINGKMKM